MGMTDDNSLRKKVTGLVQAAKCWAQAGIAVGRINKSSIVSGRVSVDHYLKSVRITTIVIDLAHPVVTGVGDTIIGLGRQMHA